MQPQIEQMMKQHAEETARIRQHYEAVLAGGGSLTGPDRPQTTSAYDSDNARPIGQESAVACAVYVPL